MGLYDRIKTRLVQPELDQLQEMAATFLSAYQEGPFHLPPEELYRQLSEYDTGMVQDLIDQLQWERLGSYTSNLDSQRQRAVEESKQAWLYSVVMQWVINLWTYYGVGETVTVIPNDDSYKDTEDRSASSVWKEFWTSDRNAPILSPERLHDISRQLLVTGNRFFIFFISELDGECTIRRARPEEITEIIMAPEDDSVPLYYKREWTDATTGVTSTIYYPDWRAYFSEDSDALEAANLPSNADTAQHNKTTAVMLHVPFNQMDDTSLYGWPLMAPAGTPWLRSHREFFQNRLAVARAKSSYVRRRTVTGGSRAVAAVRSTLMSALQSGGTYETNPPPVAGSEDIHNKQISTAELPMGTGAGDAKVDGEMFSWMAGLSGGVYPHYLGLGDSYRLATATAMERPMEMQWTLYRNRLSAMFRDICRIVLKSAEMYQKATTYSTYDSEVSTDRLVETDTEGLVTAIGTLYKEIMLPLVAAGSMPTETLTSVTVYLLQTVLQALGAADVDEMVSVDDFEKHEEEKPEEEPEPEAAPATEGAVSEKADKVIPQGKPLQPVPPSEQVVITPEDVARAIRNWDRRMPPEARGLLTATTVYGTVPEPPLEEMGEEGGPTSGHHGHAGTPGSVGGSLPGGWKASFGHGKKEKVNIRRDEGGLAGRVTNRKPRGKTEEGYWTTVDSGARTWQKRHGSLDDGVSSADKWLDNNLGRRLDRIIPPSGEGWKELD